MIPKVTKFGGSRGERAQFAPSLAQRWERRVQGGRGPGPAPEAGSPAAPHAGGKEPLACPRLLPES